jgi:uroporphyrinogen-III synthase
MEPLKLRELNVVLFEARHAKTMCDLVARQGANPISAPAMREIPLENNAAALSFAEKIIANEIDVVIFLTGVGAKTLMGAWETRHKKEEMIAALKKVTIVPRGPKPIRVLNEWGVPYALTVPEPNTWREILRALDENKEKVAIKNRSVAVQEYGVSNPELLDGLRERGAKLLVVPVYRWALPEDTGPLKQAIREITEGKAHAAVFTTAVQIEHVIRVAGELKLADKLKHSFSKIVVASVGPDCTEALRSFGISVDIQPESPKMGPLVQALADRATAVLKTKNKG